MPTRTKLLVSALLVVVSTVAQGQSSTPTRKAFDLWLQAFNSDDRKTLAAFWNTHNPAWKGIDRELAVSRESGGFTLMKIATDDGSHLEAVVADAGEMFLGVTVRMNPSSSEAPVDRIDIHGVSSQDGLIPHYTNDQELIGAVEAKVGGLVKVDKFAGTVMITRHGKVLLREAQGEADRQSHKKITMDTQFRLGSMNKMITAVSVLQLVERQKLRLDGTIGEYWHDYPNPDVANKVTIRNLLMHTAGTGDIFTSEYDARRLEVQTLEDYVKLYGNRGLEFEPGTQHRYSNYGFVLLGILIEKVSGLSYYDYVEKNVYVPAGMKATGSQPESDRVPNLAVGYQPAPAGWKSNADTLPYRGTSAGGGYSTVGDLIRFADTLTSGKLLGLYWVHEATKEQMPGTRYGYGFEADGTYFGHSGAAPGINGELRVYPRTGHVIAVLSNLEPPAGMRVAAFAGHRLPEQ
jgi:D-alanyl-D-alanine carboxypeptidase